MKSLTFSYKPRIQIGPVAGVVEQEVVKSAGDAKD